MRPPAVPASFHAPRIRCRAGKKISRIHCRSLSLARARASKVTRRRPISTQLYDQFLHTSALARTFSRAQQQRSHSPIEKRGPAFKYQRRALSFFEALRSRQGEKSKNVRLQTR